MQRRRCRWGRLRPAGKSRLRLRRIRSALNRVCPPPIGCGPGCARCSRPSAPTQRQRCRARQRPPAGIPRTGMGRRESASRSGCPPPSETGFGFVGRFRRSFATQTPRCPWDPPLPGAGRRAAPTAIATGSSSGCRQLSESGSGFEGKGRRHNSSSRQGAAIQRHCRRSRRPQPPDTERDRYRQTTNRAVARPRRPWPATRRPRQRQTPRSVRRAVRMSALCLPPSRNRPRTSLNPAAGATEANSGRIGSPWAKRPTSIGITHCGGGHAAVSSGASRRHADIIFGVVANLNAVIPQSQQVAWASQTGRTN